MDRLNEDCRHGAGFTYRLSRLKPWASKKMWGLITNNEDLFFSLHRYFQWKTEHLRTCISFFFALHYTDIFSGNRTSEDVKTFFYFSNQCDQITYKTSHCLNPALMSVFWGGAIVPCPFPFDSAF